MAAASPVEVCNQALVDLGGKTIASFTEDSTEAKLCRLRYATLRDAVTMEAEWTHSTFREGPLTPLATPPVFEFTYAFQKPTDTLSVLFVSRDADGYLEVDYAVEGEHILSDFSSPYLKYQKRVIDPAKWPPLFTEAVIARLSAEFAIPLTKSRGLKQEFMSAYVAKRDEAGTVDNLQGRNQRTSASRHRRARWRHGAYAPGFFKAGGSA